MKEPERIKKNFQNMVTSKGKNSCFHIEKSLKNKAKTESISDSNENIIETIMDAQQKYCPKNSKQKKAAQKPKQKQKNGGHLRRNQMQANRYRKN